MFKGVGGHKVANSIKRSLPHTINAIVTTNQVFMKEDKSSLNEIFSDPDNEVKSQILKKAYMMQHSQIL